jgi:hypothetical protein
MAAGNRCVDSAASVHGKTIHVIATSLDGTREALEAATALARGLCAHVVLFLWRGSARLNGFDQDFKAQAAERALRQLTASFSPRPNVLSCVSVRAIDIVQLFRSPGLVVIGGETRLWWPTAEQRLARALTQLGCHVTFVHVPRGRFVSPLGAGAREQARQRVPEAVNGRTAG